MSAGSSSGADAGRGAAAPIAVVAAVFVDGDRLLACRRAPGRADAGLWEFPGGKIEPGETPEEALRREVREELGVDVVVGALVDRSTTRVGIRDIDLACYLVTPSRTSEATGADASPSALVTASTDHDELRWVLRAEAASLGWALPDLPAVRALTVRA